MKKEPEGYLTVEAALILPFTLVVCTFIIYTGFFLYDRVLMKQDAYRAALKGSSLYQADKQERYNQAVDAMEELTGKYVAASYEYRVWVDNSVNVQITGMIRMPFKGLAKLVGDSDWEIEEMARSKMPDPVFFIRTCRQLGIEPQNRQEGEDHDTKRIYQ